MPFSFPPRNTVVHPLSFSVAVVSIYNPHDCPRVCLGVLKECAQKKLNVSADDLQLDESSSEVITVYSADGTTAHTLKISPEPNNTTSANVKDKCETQPTKVTAFAKC